MGASNKTTKQRKRSINFARKTKNAELVLPAEHLYDLQYLCIYLTLIIVNVNYALYSRYQFVRYQTDIHISCNRKTILF